MTSYSLNRATDRVDNCETTYDEVSLVPVHLHVLHLVHHSFLLLQAKVWRTILYSSTGLER